ncbi:unnamed protein product [Cunninghamella echinulata]
MTDTDKYRDFTKIETIRKELDDLEAEPDMILCCCDGIFFVVPQDKKERKKKLENELEIELAKPIKQMETGIKP